MGPVALRRTRVFYTEKRAFQAGEHAEKMLSRTNVAAIDATG
jgi:hypothetical protein